MVLSSLCAAAWVGWLEGVCCHVHHALHTGGIILTPQRSTSCSPPRTQCPPAYPEQRARHPARGIDGGGARVSATMHSLPRDEKLAYALCSLVDVQLCFVPRTHAPGCTRCRHRKATHLFKELECGILIHVGPRTGCWPGVGSDSVQRSPCSTLFSEYPLKGLPLSNLACNADHCIARQHRERININKHV